MTRKRPTKLTVRKKVLRQLDTPQLEQARGGDGDAEGEAYWTNYTCDNCADIVVAETDAYSDVMPQLTRVGGGFGNHNQAVRR